MLGEIVAFGGGAPFYIFGNNGGGNGYTPGTTILMGITERGGGDGPVARRIRLSISSTGIRSTQAAKRRAGRCLGPTSS